MKITSIILLLTIYFLSIFGVSLNEFYCCGKIKSISLRLAAERKNNCSNDDKREDCCKTKHINYKVKDNHFPSDNVAAPLNCSSDLHTFAPSYQFISIGAQEIHLINRSHAPPMYNGVPIYIYNRVFRI